MGPIPYETLQEWKQQVNTLNDPFISGIPKIELHVHIEGTLTPELRFKLAQRNNIHLHSKRLNKTFNTLDELKEMYNLLQPRSIKGANQISAFFDAYYGGMEALRTESDFYELAMDYFEKAARMNVRYCIGLDGNEYNRPPSIFEPLSLRARNDGFKITCHCDVTQKDTHEHIRQVAECVGGSGADRLDHGLDAAERPELASLIKEKGNLKLLRLKAGFTDEEIEKVELDSVEMCWAGEDVKREIREEIRRFCEKSTSET
ncbi:putative Uncharacterized deaminase [Glarea lozoyensis 74030]|uniref:Putative Uncharacterized deaminase n=1 Tax=Glarea lozoyensis (strain ATCC 74030 / MF5533) TaxID=1104152 RepID=H0EQX5_GLAL7|nr:putative Uncharacterized deaminase [Glarea lozoyensis 74030]